MPATLDMNYLAVLAGAVISLAIGALWYSPPLFGNAWLALIGKTKEQAEQDLLALREARAVAVAEPDETDALKAERAALAIAHHGLPAENVYDWKHPAPSLTGHGDVINDPFGFDADGRNSSILSSHR